MQEYAWLLWLVAIVAVFWLLIIRPNQQRQKAAARLQASISVGDEVMLTSGIFGTVTDLGDDHAMVQIAAGTTIRVARGAIGNVVDQTADGPTDESTEDF